MEDEVDNVQIKIGKTGFSLMNAQLTPFGGIKHCSWKSLRGFIKVLRQQNKLLTKHNTRVKFEIILPIPD